jgi:hypothetical protein
MGQQVPQHDVGRKKLLTFYLVLDVVCKPKVIVYLCLLCDNLKENVPSKNL